MTEKERKKAVKELREEIIPIIRVNNLINNPDKNIKGQGILRAKAIFTNFDYSDGQRLEELIQEFLGVARAGVRHNHIKNLANDINNFIVGKTEEMNFYVIPGNEFKQKRNRIIKVLKDKNYHVRSVMEGKDFHLFITKKGDKNHVHLIFDNKTNEIRVDPKDQKPDELLSKVISIDTKEGKQIKAKIQGNTTSLQFIDSKQEETTYPILYILPRLGSTGGPDGHFIYFIIKNIKGDIALNIRWGIKADDYEWTSEGEPFELEPNQMKEVEFPISKERPFKEELTGLYIFIKYKDALNNSYTSKSDLIQKKVPSGAFYKLEIGKFYPPYN